MKKVLISLGIIGFISSLALTVTVISEPNLANIFKTNIKATLTESIQTATVKDPDKPYKETSENYLQAANEFLSKKDYQNALSNINTAYNLNPSEDNLMLYTLTLIQNKNFEEAQNMLASSSPKNQTAFFYKGVIFVYEGKDYEAKESFKTALSLSGKIEPALIQNFITAYSSFESQMDGQRIYLNAMLAKASIDAKFYSVAEVLSKQILEEKADYRDVWMLLGYSFLKTLKYAEAEDAFLKAKSIDQVKPEIHYFIGVARYENGDYLGATEELQLSLLYGFEPKAEVYKRIAESQKAAGNAEEALSAYEYLLNIDQSSLGTFEDAVKVAINDVKDFGRALTLATLATTAFPSSEDAWNLLTEANLAAGDTQKATEANDTALGINPFYAEGYYQKGLILEAKNEAENAKAAYKKAYELASESGKTTDVDLKNQAATKYNSLIIPTK
ncbi:MAG: tetratricopeptide repeat protein [Candidatus Gracilibacteria bacterium]|jgi:Flp pilus assembly protein TadD